jgi:hypothetical protein
MRINLVKSAIAIGVCGLIAFGFYRFHDGENKSLLSLGSFLFSVVTLLWTIGINFEFPKTTTMIRTVSGIFFFVALLSNFLFSFSDFSAPLYVIVNGVIMLIYVLIVYTISKAKQ